jgi:hypothetical protein
MRLLVLASHRTDSPTAVVTQPSKETYVPIFLPPKNLESFPPESRG